MKMMLTMMMLNRMEQALPKATAADAAPDDFWMIGEMKKLKKPLMMKWRDQLVKMPTMKKHPFQRFDALKNLRKMSTMTLSVRKKLKLMRLQLDLSDCVSVRAKMMMKRSD
jgi:hypothetical protein